MTKQDDPHGVETGAGTGTGPVALASDHAALALKADVAAWLQERGIAVVDLGPHTADSVDYPDFAQAMAQAIKEGTADRGVLMCGSGIGMSIAVNREPLVRGALVHDAYGARMCRQHNDANVLVLGARTTGMDIARECVDIFLDTEFEGGRHARRVGKMSPGTET
ncbi:MAG: ribose 5-phosphate isomerase B [Rhodospirillaceae bacterium]